MRHPDITRWTDFARDLVSGETRRAMTEHLGSGCRRCARALSAIRRLIELGEAEQRHGPPDYALRSVKALYRLEYPERARLLTPLALQLAYDSLVGPAPVATRSLQVSSRQLVYYAQDYALDLRMDYPSGSHEMELGGEILNRKTGPISDVPAFLIVGDKVACYSVSGPMGEFSMRCNPHGSLRLCLLVNDDECLDVTLDRRRSPEDDGALDSPPGPEASTGNGLPVPRDLRPTN